MLRATCYEIYLYLNTILPRLVSVGENSIFTRSPGMIFIKYLRILPETIPNTNGPCCFPSTTSSLTRYIVLGNDSVTVPSLVITSAFGIKRTNLKSHWQIELKNQRPNN